MTNMFTVRRIKLKNTSKFVFSVGIKEDIEAIINHFFVEKKSVRSVQQGLSTSDAFENLPKIEFEDEEDEEEDFEA